MCALEAWACHLVQCRSSGQARYPSTNNQHGVLGVSGPGAGCSHAWVISGIGALRRTDTHSVEPMKRSHVHLFVEVQ
jgi:hypothetical protein